MNLPASCEPAPNMVERLGVIPGCTFLIEFFHRVQITAEVLVLIIKLYENLELQLQN
jgi:hypothetical protein